MKTSIIVAAIAVVILLGGCGRESSEAEVAAKTAAAAEVAAGEKLFLQYCGSCHERKGRGNYIHNIPATLLTRRSKKELMDWIRGSDKHREMPNFRQLSDEERGQLAIYLLEQTKTRR